jgi:hypothetical protein
MFLWEHKHSGLVLDDDETIRVPFMRQLTKLDGHHLTSPLSRVAKSNSLLFLKQVKFSRRMSWAGHAALMGEKRNAYRILVGKPEGKRPLGKT